MKPKTIDVDAEVHARLMAESKRRLETPNTVLRRLLELDPAPIASVSRSMMSTSLNEDMAPPRSTFNIHPSTLKSVLLQASTVDRQPLTVNLPSLPHHIPTTLEHTLQMVHLVRTQGMTRIEATKALADWHRVAIPTVTIKFTRLLGISAHEIDELLVPARRSDLVGLLTSHFPDYRDVIETVV